MLQPRRKHRPKHINYIKISSALSQTAEFFYSPRAEDYAHRKALPGARNVYVCVVFALKVLVRHSFEIGKKQLPFALGEFLAVKGQSVHNKKPP